MLYDNTLRASWAFLRNAASSGPLPLQQRVDLRAKLPQLRYYLIVLHRFRVGRLALDIEGSSRFEHAALNVAHAVEPLAVERCHQLSLGEQLLGQRFLPYASIFDQQSRLPFEDLIEPTMPEQEADDQIIHRHQRKRAD